MRTYSSSRITVGLVALELERRSGAHGWGVTSNLAHPGVARTSLLAARPEIGRTVESREVRLIRRQRLYRSLRSVEDARRMWQLSERLTGVSFPADGAVHGAGPVGGERLPA